MSRSSFDQDDDRTIRYFTGLLSERGMNAQSLDWASKSSQALRFSVLAQVGDLQHATVLDVGCGLGDFVEWLTEHGVAVDYTGIDITPLMIESARQRFSQGFFHVQNLLRDNGQFAVTYDFVFASGLFYYRQIDPYGFLERMVTAMFERCRRALAFNSLSYWAPKLDPTEFHADPLKVLSICKKLTPWVVLRHDYHPHDFSVYLYRERRTP